MGSVVGGNRPPDRRTRVEVGRVGTAYGPDPASRLQVDEARPDHHLRLHTGGSGDCFSRQYNRALRADLEGRVDAALTWACRIGWGLVFCGVAKKVGYAAGILLWSAQ